MTCGNPGRRDWRCRLGTALLGALLSTAAFAQESAVRIAYVDMQRLIDSAPQIVQGRARLTREFAAADAQLKLDERRLADLESQRDDQNSPDIAIQADALRRSIERSRARLREEMATRVQQETDSAWPVIEAAVADYARDQGYDLIVQGPVLYASGRIDVTDRILDQLRLAQGDDSR